MPLRYKEYYNNKAAAYAQTRQMRLDEQGYLKMTIETEYSGKDIEEAINNACQSTGLPREQLVIKITSPGSAGIFGLLRKKAVILVSPKDGTDKPLARKPSTRLKPHTPDAGKRNIPPPGKSVDRAIAKRLSEDFPKKEPVIPARDASPEILDEIQNITKKILDLMGYAADVSLSQSKGKVLVQISGNNLENIVGEEGNTLDALQYLVRKIVSQKFSEKIMLSMDAGDFRETRKQELQELALEMARIVKEGKKYRIIAPLNPAERRIIHLTLQTDTTIRSKSIGEGLFKKIKIYLPGQARKNSSRRRAPSKSRPPKKE
jgi:spoIIIJ-associated protein